MTGRRCLAALALAVFSVACHREHAPPAPPRLVVSRAQGPITVNGLLDEPAWPKAAHSPPFEDATGRQAPFADLSAMADDDALYLSVYVADEDLRSDGDTVTLDVGPLHLVLGPKGCQVPAGVQVGTDLDGEVDDPAQDDEEWVSEIRIPRALLPSNEVSLRVVRVDAGRAGRPHALAWPRAAPAILDLTGLAMVAAGAR